MAEGSESRSGSVGAELRVVGHGLWELELAKRNFDDPRHEWRRLFAEVLGRYDLKLWIDSLRESATYPPA